MLESTFIGQNLKQKRLKPSKKIKRVKTKKGCELAPAESFSLKALTTAYNQTRVDYIVPMPMTEGRLQAYIDAYDISLAHSCVVIDKMTQEILGIGMLGMRPQRSWITRLGVLPNARGRGVGKLLMRQLINSSRNEGLSEIWLEVIEGNKPAHELFKKLGFQQTRRLIVSRRAPGTVVKETEGPQLLTVDLMEKAEALARLSERSARPNWLNETETFENAQQIMGLKMTFEGGGVGWVTYEIDTFQLKRIVIGVTHGETATITAAILSQVHKVSPVQDAICENISDDDPRWAGYEAMGYFNTFYRIEMVKKLATQ